MGNAQDKLAQDKPGNGMIRACCSGKLEEVKKLLNDPNFDVDYQNSNGSTALICAAMFGRSSVCNLLLGVKGIDVNLQNKDGNSAFHDAACSGLTSVCELLLDMRADLKLHNNYGWTPLMFCIFNNKKNTTKFLISRGAICEKELLRMKELKNWKYGYKDKDLTNIIVNWKLYLPQWNRFKTTKFYPSEFKELAITFIVCMKNYKVNGKKIPKDLWYLILEYIAEVWLTVSYNGI